MQFKSKRFTKKEDILDFDIQDSTTLKVKEFYEQFPFPNYKSNDNDEHSSANNDTDTADKPEETATTESHLYSFFKAYSKLSLSGVLFKPYSPSYVLFSFLYCL